MTIKELEYEIALHKFFVEAGLKRAIRPAMRQEWYHALNFGVMQGWLAEEYHVDWDGAVNSFVFVLTDAGRERFFNRTP